MATPAEGFSRLLAVLDRMEIPYYVGGSVASSAHGIPRTTMYLGLVADLAPDPVDEFASLLQPDFYADAAMMREALARGRSFNLVLRVSGAHLDLAYMNEWARYLKVDDLLARLLAE